jgi:hypothetical protein
VQIIGQIGLCSGIDGQYPQLEYKAEIGDTQAYRYLRFYDTRQIDPSRGHRTYINTNGETITATLQEGTVIEYEIIGISELDIDVRISIEDQVTYEERNRNGILIKTGDETSLENTFNDIETITIQENYIVETVNDSSFVGDDGIFYNLAIYSVSKWDINTGWLIRQYALVYDTESIYYETELILIDSHTINSTTSNENRMTRIGLLVIIIILLAFINLYPKKN